jgi:hypothetical protein
MTPATKLLFTVSLRHLASDGKRAGTDIPNAQLHHVSVKELRALVTGLEKLAPAVVYPAEPEARISGPTGEFVVRVKDGRLHLVTWSTAHKGGAGSAAEMLGVITGQEEQPEVVRSPRLASRSASSSFKEKLTLFALGLAIVVVNTFTLWLLTRPPRTTLANYRLVAPEQAQRILADVAGVYETGRQPGDRRLEIAKDATVQRVKLGPEGGVRDTQMFTVQAAEANGRPALLTSRKSLITIKDNISLVLYGDTYSRVAN